MPRLKLLPYLTANVKFGLDTRRDVLRVPNAAIRWKPHSYPMADYSEAKQTALVQNGFGLLWLKDEAGNKDASVFKFKSV